MIIDNEDMRPILHGSTINEGSLLPYEKYVAKRADRPLLTNFVTKNLRSEKLG
jgi:hypothetical protein